MGRLAEHLYKCVDRCNDVHSHVRVSKVRFCACVSILASPYIEFPRWPAPTVEMRALPSSRSRRERSITTMHAMW